MPIFRGTNSISKIFRGNTEIVKAFRGTDLIFTSFQLPQYELIADVNVTTATTQIDFDNLNITKDDELRLVYTAVGGSGTFRWRIFPNNLTNESNYHTQILEGSGSSLVAGRLNVNNLVNPDNRKNSGYADIKISNNDRFVVQSQEIWNVGSGSSGIRNSSNNIVGTQTVSSITKLSIISVVSNGILANSRLTLYKVNTGVA